MRVKIFIDFWNFQLSWNEFHQRKGASSVVRIPWNPLLYETLVRHVDPAAVYAGTHVYASYDPNNPADKKLRGFLNVMDGFPGYDVLLKERKPQGPVRCPDCRQAITVCPHCKQAIHRTVEKGIDTALATDLIRIGIDACHTHSRGRRSRSCSGVPGTTHEAGDARLVSGPCVRTPQRLLGPRFI